MNNFVCFTFRIFQIIGIKISNVSFFAVSCFFDLGSRKDNPGYDFIFLNYLEFQFYPLKRKYFHHWINNEIKNFNSGIKILMIFQYFIYYVTLKKNY